MREQVQSLKPTALLEILNEVAVLANSQIPYAELLQRILRVVTQHLACEAGVIFQWNEQDGLYHMAAYYGMSEELALDIEQRRARGMGGGTSAEVFATGRTFLLESVASDLRFKGRFPQSTERSFLNIPFTTSTRIPLTMALMTNPGTRLSREDIPILDAVGHQLGLILENAILLSESRRCEQESSTLYQLSTEISSALEMEPLLQVIACKVRQLTATDVGFVAMAEEEGQMVIRAMDGEKGQRMLQQTLDWTNIPSGEAIVWNDWGHAPDDEVRKTIDASVFKEMGVRSMLIAPISRGEHVFGIIGALSWRAQAFKPHHLKVLTRLAPQISIAIENASLYRQVRVMATLEERNRLARELHDDLAQALGSMKMQSAMGLAALGRGENEFAESAMLTLDAILSRSYEDVREAIFSLSDPVRFSGDFVADLRDYLIGYELHYGLHVDLDVKHPHAAAFSDEVAAQVDRILKEALTNTRKHSGARDAKIRMQKNGEWSLVQVMDHGSGFDPLAFRADRMHGRGIRIMHERAQSIGGDLRIISAPDEGTNLELRVPLQRSKLMKE